MILVADDHADTREALVRLLQLKGREAIAVADGAQLLLFLRTHPLPELVILDVSMPHADGLAVLRAVRADRRTVGVPVVMFSADDRPIDEAMRLGAHAYVVKGSLAWVELSDQVDRLAASQREVTRPPNSITYWQRGLRPESAARHRRHDGAAGSS